MTFLFVCSNGSSCEQDVVKKYSCWLFFEDKSVLIQYHVPYIFKKTYGISSHLPLRFSSEVVLFSYIIAGFLHPLNRHKPQDQSPLGKGIILAGEWASAAKGAHQMLLILPSSLLSFLSQELPSYSSRTKKRTDCL